MARKRMIDPDIWKSRQVCGLNDAEFRLYVFLISQADDEGRLQVKEDVWRRDINLFRPWSSTKMTNSLQALVDCALVCAYQVNGERYLCHPNWRKYQWLNRPTDSRLPAPPDMGHSEPLTEHSQSTHRALTANEGRKEGTGRRRRAAESAAAASPEDRSPEIEHRCSGADAPDGAAPAPALVEELVRTLARKKEFV